MPMMAASNVSKKILKKKWDEPIMETNEDAEGLNNKESNLETFMG